MANSPPTILFLLLFLLSHPSIFSLAMINAIQNDCPFAIGSIYVQYPQMQTVSGFVTVNFNSPFTGFPIGILIAPRTLEVSATSQYRTDYYFKVQSYTSTQFVVEVKMAQTHSIQYSKIIAHYFTTSISSLAIIHSQIPDSVVPAVQMSSTTMTMYWTLDLSSQFFQPGSTYNIKSLAFISQLTVDYSAGDFSTSLSSQVNSGSKTIEYSVSFDASAAVQTVQLSCFIYDVNISSSINYDIGYEPMNLFSSSQVVKLPLYVPYVTLFIGIESFQSGTGDRLGYNFGFQNEPGARDSLDYRQSNPQTSISKSQQTSPTMQCSGKILYFYRKQCSTLNGYIYSDVLTQRCYEKACPLGKYPNANNQCLSCFDCQTSSSCSACYSNACNPDLYFDTSSLPYKCVFCSTPIPNCNACTNGPNGVTCTLCAQGYFYKATDQMCKLCSTVIPNCQTCGSSGNTCQSCTVSSRTELASQGTVCQPCNSTSYYNINDRKCYQCNSSISYCDSCDSFLIKNAVYQIKCFSCDPASMRELRSNTCALCDSQSHYNSSTKACAKCDSTLSYCEECYSAPNGLTCSKCIASSNTELISGGCHLCSGTQYFEQTNKQCVACSSTIPYCSTCTNSSRGLQCTQCFSSAFTINNGICQSSCNSFQFLNTTGYMCELCSISIQNCTECSVQSSSLICTACDNSVRDLIVDNNICLECILPSYYNRLTETCTLCDPNCLECVSQTTCVECAMNSSVSTMLNGGSCAPCNNDSANPSPLSLCFQNKICYYSTYNQQSDQCQFPEIVGTVMLSLTTVASIPNINMFSSTLSNFIWLFDDLSYYTYHHRDYSSHIQLVLLQMTNFTLARFIPFQLTEFYDRFQISYNTSFNAQNLTETFPEFYENDESMYFLITTSSTIQAFATSMISFCLFMILHWLINQWVKNNVFKNFSYLGMIIVSLFNANLQYLSFRCFAQLYQIVPYTSLFYINLVFTYFILFVVIIYGISAIVVFSNLYQKLSREYVVEDLFEQSWIVWFSISNILKISTGFVHAYFYTNHFVQSLLLTILYSVRAIGFTLSRRYIDSKLEFTFQMINNYLLLILQGFFMIESLLNYFYDTSFESLEYLGQTQFALLVLMIVTELVSMAFLSAKSVIQYLIMKLKKPSIKKQLIADIQTFKIDTGQAHQCSKYKTTRLFSDKTHKEIDSFADPVFTEANLISKPGRTDKEIGFSDCDVGKKGSSSKSNTHFNRPIRRKGLMSRNLIRSQKMDYFDEETEKRGRI